MLDKKTEVQLMINEDKLIAKMLDTKIDLTIYSDRELELQVFNTFDLYELIQDITQLKKELKKRFIYTRKQYELLMDEIKELTPFKDKLRSINKYIPK